MFLSPARSGSARSGSVQLGSVRLGSVQLGSVRDFLLLVLNQTETCTFKHLKTFRCRRGVEQMKRLCELHDS